MIYPTTEEEKRAFCRELLPYFMEYLRTHQSAIEQVELASSKEGIISFPATQSLGGVLKTVRVPLSMLTVDIDVAVEEVAEKGLYAKNQGDYAKAQGDYAKGMGDYAEDEGDYAQAQGDAALAAKNTVTTWYTPFRSDSESWLAGIQATWTAWFSDTLATGVRSIWNTFYAATTAAWNGFFGTSADDPAGVRKIWSNWFAQAQSDTAAAIADAEDTAEHPTYIGNDNYVYVWNKQAQTYNKTSVYVRGEGFHVSKVFVSIAEMEAYDAHDLKEGDFVLINSGDTQDPDNAKLYTYDGTAGHYTFLVDMSGAIGFTGKTPQFSIGLVNTGSPTAPAVVTITADGTDSDGNPKYKLNFTIPQGIKGDKGDKGDDLHWSEMTQQEKEELAALVLGQIAFDDVPTQNSDKAVKSGGIYNALQSKSDNNHTHDDRYYQQSEVDELLETKQDVLTFASIETCEDIIDELT